MGDTNNGAKAALYALFKGSEQVSKAHSTKEAVWVEAVEMKIVYEGRLGPRGEYIKRMQDEYYISAV